HRTAVEHRRRGVKVQHPPYEEEGRNKPNRAGSGTRAPSCNPFGDGCREKTRNVNIASDEGGNDRYQLQVAQIPIRRCYAAMNSENRKHPSKPPPYKHGRKVYSTRVNQNCIKQK